MHGYSCNHKLLTHGWSTDKYCHGHVSFDCFARNAGRKGTVMPTTFCLTCQCGSSFIGITIEIVVRRWCFIKVQTKNSWMVYRWCRWYSITSCTLICDLCSIKKYSSNPVVVNVVIKGTFISKNCCSFMIAYYHLFGGVEASFIRNITPFLIRSIFHTRLIAVWIVKHFGTKCSVFQVSMLPDKSPSTSINAQITINLEIHNRCWSKSISLLARLYKYITGICMSP